jgi:hypothetical protein
VRGKPQHAKQEAKPKGKAQRDLREDKGRRAGLDSFADKRPAATKPKQGKPDPRKAFGKPPGGKSQPARPHSGKRHTGKPVRGTRGEGR